MSSHLIIGASGGIGNAVALKISEGNEQVYGTYFSNKINSTSNYIEYYYLNVLDELMDFEFLPEAINGLVYCPGTINLKPFERISPENFVADFTLQVVGAIKVIKEVLPKLKKSGNASIVLFSTVAVQTGFNYHSQVATSKGAIEGLTRSLAAEFAPYIRVNCIAPSITDTNLAAPFLNTDLKKQANAQKHPLKKIGSVNDIANMTQYLLSEKSGWITGQVFHVDGGMSTIRI